jgi:dimethylamine--corrinoid protein Co-methyltransferase
VGSGDAYGMPCAHTMASGMGGMRTAGDLVGRLQMTRGMRLPEAKKYVADRLAVAPADLSDPVLMNELREQLGLGRITTFEISHPTQAVAIESKFNVEELLGVPVNSVRRFEERTAGTKGATRP